MRIGIRFAPRALNIALIRSAKMILIMFRDPRVENLVNGESERCLLKLTRR
jgi:hypothetical protein